MKIIFFPLYYIDESMQITQSKPIQINSTPATSSKLIIKVTHQSDRLKKDKPWNYTSRIGAFS